MKKQLTIVIPCKNEGEIIVTTINKLIKDNLDVKIIVADSSDDGITDVLLKELKLQYPKKIKIVKGGIPSVARNKGFAQVKTDYVLFLDSDIFIEDSNLLSNALKTIVDGEYDLVTVKFRTIEKKYDYVYQVFDIIQWFTSKTKPFALGGFMLFRSEKFKEVGGFNDTDKIAEDYRLSSKITPKKFRVINDIVYTTSRRFQKKGLWYMIKLMLGTWINRNNDNFFKNDYNYWK